MKKQQKGFVLAILLAVTAAAHAQVQFSGWLASFNNYKLSDRFSLHFDAQLRSTDDWQQVGSILLRPGLNYRLNKTVTFTTGYGLILGRRTVGGLSSLLPEHRIWQQVLAGHKLGKAAITHRFRFEERFLPRPVVNGDKLQHEGHDQAFRFRYFVRGLIPLNSVSVFAKGPYLALQNEVFLNTGNKTTVNGKTFDQNRLYGAVGYRLNAKTDLEAGYLNQYTTTRSAFVNNHVMQLAVYKRL